MKNIFLALLLIVSTSVFAEDAEFLEAKSILPTDENEFIETLIENSTLRFLGLNYVVGKRCNYVGMIDALTCKSAVSALIGHLDFDIVFMDGSHDAWVGRPFLFVAFKTELINFLRNKELTSYLEQFNDQLDQTIATKKAVFNLWDFTNKFTGSTKLSTKLIAILLQDTSVSQTHIGYMEHFHLNEGVLFKKNLQLLSQAIGSINYIKDNVGDFYNQMLLPKSIDKSLKNSIYHYYVPRLLAQKLKSQNYSSTAALQAATLFNFTYEIASLNDSHKYLFNDPVSIPKSQSWTIRDIHLGYLGALDGSGSIRSKVSLKTSESHFTKSIATALTTLID
jgi:hypothetical protein